MLRTNKLDRIYPGETFQPSPIFASSIQPTSVEHLKALVAG